MCRALPLVAALLLGCSSGVSGAGAEPEGEAATSDVLSADTSGLSEVDDVSAGAEVSDAEAVQGAATPDGSALLDVAEGPVEIISEGCGDGVCGGDESCESCPEDCPLCVPEIGSIVITEVMKDPDAVMDSLGEWIEVVNVSGQAIEMSGMLLRDEGTDAHVISPEASFIIEPGAYVVFGVTADLGVGLSADEVVSGFMLDNSADEVILQAGETVLDALYYDDVSFVDPVGASMKLHGGEAPNATTNDEPEAWCVSTQSFGLGDRGTPGEANPACEVCGDTICGPSETCEVCPQDCGACTPCEEGGMASPESCNGIDDDCDDAIDESTCSDNLGCTTDECIPGQGCIHTPAPGGCAVDGYCVSDGAYNPANACQVCDTQNSQSAWTNLNGGPCNDETPCTNNDMCVMGACVGSAVEDSYEHNDTKSTAVPLGEAKDDMNWGDDATQLWASLYGEGDVDWYQFIATDTFWGKIRPRVDLLNVPAGSSYELCLFMVCNNGEPIELKGCLSGEEATNADGLSGCCSSESVKLDLNCEGASDDGVAFVSVTHKGGFWTCDNYSIIWGDD